MKYEPVIGLEVHVELKTKSKMFCSCRNDWFGKPPNTYTCPVCLGLPGALPVPNEKAIEWCIMIAFAFNCEINLFSKFDRKNYFYPDLPKGYQISQYDLPFGRDGHTTLANGKTIHIRRVHMEEDTGKLMHKSGKSLIDFNRSGVPLVEIVTEPDFDNAKDVREYLQKLQQVVRYLEVANADMEKGEMRLEPNISLRSNASKSKDLPSYKVEVKNINSFSFVEKAINYELKRQEELLDRETTPAQETRGWDEKKQITLSQRSKEDAMDYRYFPEPDIPPIVHTKEQISKLKSRVPELPEEKINHFVKNFNLSLYDATILTKEKALADFFEASVEIMKKSIDTLQSPTPKHIANWIINKKINPEEIIPAELIKQIITAQQISGIDGKELEKTVQEVLNANSKAVADYKKGKENVLMFLLGQAMMKLKGKAKAEDVKKQIVSLLNG